MHASSKWLVGLVAVILIIPLPVFFGYDYPLFLPYYWHKTLHVIGAVLFLGNIIVTGVWMFLAERTRQPTVMAFAARVVNWADVFFTGPGITLVLFNGLILAAQWGGLYRVGWIALALFLFTLSGLVWVVWLLPYQHRLIRLSQAVDVDGLLSPEFFRVLHRWYLFGGIATILPLVSLVLMVIKPHL